MSKGGKHVLTTEKNDQNAYDTAMYWVEQHINTIPKEEGFKITITWGKDDPESCSKCGEKGVTLFFNSLVADFSDSIYKGTKSICGKCLNKPTDKAKKELEKLGIDI
jgi:hypothetical protein